MLRPPSAAASAAPAEWVQKRYLWGGPWVTREVGTEFEAYVRVLHPSGEGDAAQSWAEVAAKHGKTMHAAAAWDEITTDGPWTPNLGYRGSDNGGIYLEGNLPGPVLAAVCRVLRAHTTTPDNCYFAVWDGWGWDTTFSNTFTRDGEAAPAARPMPTVRLDPDAPRFAVTHRDFRLYEGVVEEALDIGGKTFVEEKFLWQQSPTLMWPADQAWCVSTELDAEYTIVGGSADMAAQLLETDAVEAFGVAADEPPTSPINQ